jgi:uncharacterized protein YecE (DUF72 family)
MKYKSHGNFYSGTSGLVVPVPKHSFPPEFEDKSRLTFYASLLNSIEINSSFYKLPRGITIRKWAESVPADFKFTFKLWKEVTHNKGLTFRTEDLENFMKAIDEAGDKKGCLLIQFPPSLKADNIIQLSHLLDAVQNTNADNAWKVAIEFRDRSWYKDEVYELIDQYEYTMVLHDKASSNAPLQELTADFIYLRFHGPEGNYRGSYDDDFLYEYAQYIKAWLEDGKSVYVYFNNTMGAALDNLSKLNKFAGS